MHKKRKRIALIGIGDDGRKSLSKPALERIVSCELLAGGKRHLSFFDDLPDDVIRVCIDKKLKEAIAKIRSSSALSIVVLVSGDPFFFGLGEYLLKAFKEDDYDIGVYPSVSSMQLAFARLGMKWDDAHLISLHARPFEPLVQAVKQHRKVALFTDDVNTPTRIASELLFWFSALGERKIRMSVCEHLGGEKEKITTGFPEEMQDKDFSSLNVVVLERLADHPYAEPFSGIPESEFFQRKPKSGLITKSEIRSVALAKLCLKPDSVVWDIGAGSGACSIEAASFAVSGKVYAIEKNSGDAENIEKNRRKFAMAHCAVIEGKAPEVLQNIPDDPDAVFIGGSCGKLKGIITRSVKRLKPGGRIVVNLIALENLQQGMEVMKELGIFQEVISLNISRSSPILNLTRFEPLTPVFILCGQRDAEAC